MDDRTLSVYTGVQKKGNSCYAFSLLGREQSMKPMIGKSIDQSMTIDALLVNWHRPIDDQSIITQKWSQLIDCHRLALKNLGIPHLPPAPVLIRTCSTHKYLRFEFARQIVCMQLHGFKNQLQKHSLKQYFEETQVNNTPSRLTVPFAVLYTVDVGLI